MDAVLFAAATLAPLLVILVVVHELGHFATARAMGVKVLEFGVGFPPRAFGLYAGRTPVRLYAGTQYHNLAGPGELRPGQRVLLYSAEAAAPIAGASAGMGGGTPRIGGGTPGIDGGTPGISSGVAGIDSGVPRMVGNADAGASHRRNPAEGELVARIIEAKPRRGGYSSENEAAARQSALLRHEGIVREVRGDSIVLADMLYSFNWLPLGGFVRLAGESDPAVPRSLAAKGAGTRLLVLAAGPLMNVVLPVAVLMVLFMVPREAVVGRLAVDAVLPETAAAAAQLQPGDIIVEANGDAMERGADFARAINLNGGAPMTLLVERAGQPQRLSLAPRFDNEASRWMAGVRLELQDRRTVREAQPFWEAIPNGFVSVWELLVLLRQNLAGAFSQGSGPQLSGPIGIAQATGELTRQDGLNGWLSVGILLSINLAILNLLPFPMLDGGRIVFVVIEWVRRGKRISPEKEGLVHLIGLVALLGLIAAVSANDIARIIAN